MSLFEELEKLKYTVLALLFNIFDWFLLKVFGPPKEPKLGEQQGSADGEQLFYVQIDRPGSIHQLKVKPLPPNAVTVGYNVPGFSRPNKPLVENFDISNLSKVQEDMASDCVVLRIHFFSVNYADCCIRWGLYESANKFVGYPICPGFDVSGVVEWAGAAARSEFGLKPGDRVFGCSLFGGYSGRCLVPARQLRKVPLCMFDGGVGDTLCVPSFLGPMSRAAALPAVSFTALHALWTAGLYVPGSEGAGTGIYGRQLPLENKAVLVHSAAGGVGSLLMMMSREFGAETIVGVVGRKEKVRVLEKLMAPENQPPTRREGAKKPTVLIQQKTSLWKKGSPTDQKFGAIFDANGVETLQHSYDHLALGGRLVIYGFHTNLPLNAMSINPLSWLKMAGSMFWGMPKFQPMDLTVDTKSVLGFNLSFFSQEKAALSWYFDEIVGLISRGVIGARLASEERADRGKEQGTRIFGGASAETGVVVEVMKIGDIKKAHEKISSGRTVGKIVVQA
eukprot:Hpha_TRINITY_DN15594_c2_g6::TRINITY_DN15594_c2_g6_i1::g.107781::m.107781